MDNNFRNGFEKTAIRKLFRKIFPKKTAVNTTSATEDALDQLINKKQQNVKDLSQEIGQMSKRHNEQNKKLKKTLDRLK